MKQTKTKSVGTVEAALEQLLDAHEALAALTPVGDKLRAARAAVEAARGAAWQAACSEYLKSTVWRAQPYLTVQRRGGKAWLTSTNGAALLYHAPECGWLDIAGDCGYSKKHAAQLAPVTAVMFGPSMVGLWYATAEGKTYWNRLCGDDCRRVRFSLRLADGSVQALPTSSFDIPKH